MKKHSANALGRSDDEGVFDVGFIQKKGGLVVVILRQKGTSYSAT